MLPLQQVQQCLERSKARILSIRTRQRQIGRDWREDNTLRFELIDEKKRFESLLFYTESLKPRCK
jgi:hypothetical protein